MKASDLRTKTQDELETELNTVQKELFNLRMKKNAGGEAAKTLHLHDFKTMRRKIARIKTILNEKK